MENSTGTDFFTKRVVLLKKSDCERRDGKIFMPTTIDMAKIKKPNTGQYSKVRFSKSMPEEMVRQTLQEAFPSFNLTGRFHCASYGQGSTTFIFHGNPGVWNGKMIKKTVRGNSVLYILLEDDQMPQESPHVTKDAFNSSAPVPLPNLNQPILSDSSATAMVQNTMQPPNDSPMQEFNIPLRPSAASTNCNLIKPQNMADSVALHRLNQSTFTSTDTSATIMTQHNMQPCSYFQVQGSSIPPGPSATSTNFNVKNPQEIIATVAFPNINQPSLSDSSTAVMVQNNMQPWNAFQMQECSIPSESSEILASNPNFSTPELRNAAPADGGLDFTTMVDRWLETPGFFDHIMTDDSDHTGTSEMSNLQPPNQGFFFNSPEISDSSADNNNTTSGISELGHNLSSDDLSPHEEEQFEFSVTPERVPLQGGNLCRFQSKRPLPRNVQSASAIFEHLDTVNIKRCGDDCLDGDKIPPSNTPGEVNIFLKRADGEVLGETKIWYYDQDKEALQRIIENPQLQADFFRNYSVMLTNRNTATASGPEAQNSGIFGSTEPVQMLCVLVYAAAEIGGEQFIKMIFNSSAGRIIYDLYKDNSALPEAIAREYGHEKIATYLEGITGRYSKESNDAPNYPQTIDWSELVRAAEEAQKQPSFSSEEKSNHLESNGRKDTGYFGDIDTSSNESCESVSSESEDNIALASSEEMDYLVDELSGITLVHKDQEFGIKKAAAGQNLTSFRNTGLFNRCRGNSTVSNKVVLRTKKRKATPPFSKRKGRTSIDCSTFSL